MIFTYLWINILTVLVPFIFSFHPKLNFYKKFRYFFPANLLVATIFILWDIYFTKNGVWGFNPDYISGIYFSNLPVEEILFFICIPFACVFTYHSLNLFTEIKWKRSTEDSFIIGLSSVLIFTGLIYYSRLYTSVTFISLGLLILIIKYKTHVNWFPKLFTIYGILLFPFLVVNGILTGTGLSEPVVWYNNNENIGIRLFTIPLEDIFYGFELLLLNVYLYEYFRNKLSEKKEIIH